MNNPAFIFQQNFNHDSLEMFCDNNPAFIFQQNFNHDSSELFLDILTKEEKEALLSKKMEAIRKKNVMLQNRHAVRNLLLNMFE